MSFLGGVIDTVEEFGGTVSDELKNCTSGGCDPGVILNNELKRGSRSIGAGLAQPLREEFDKAMDRLFDEKVNPLVTKIDQMTNDRIKQTGKQMESIVKFTIEHFSELEDEIHQDVENIIDNVDGKIKDNVKLVFTQIQHTLAETILVVRGLIGEIDNVLESRIKQLTMFVMEALAAVDTIVDKVFDRLNELERQLFRDFNEILDKIDRTIIGTQAWADLIRIRATEHLVPNPFHPCYQRDDIKLLPGLALPNDMLYRLTECKRLYSLEEDLETTTVERVFQDYAFLQGEAWNYITMNRGVPAEEDLYAKDYLKYGHLYKIWNAFSESV